MAVPTTGNVLVGKPLATGGVLIAPTGTALPPDETSALNASFVAAGYITDDGLTKSDSIDSSVVRAWGGVIIAAPITGRTATFQFSFAEQFNAIGHGLLWTDAAITTTAKTASVGTKLKIVAGAYVVPPHKSFVFDMWNGGLAKDRIVVPDGQVSDLGDVVYSDGDITARQVTITAFPDATGNYYYEYTNDGVFP